MSHELDRETAAYFNILQAVADIEGAIKKIELLARFSGGSKDSYLEYCERLRETLMHF